MNCKQVVLVRAHITVAEMLFVFSELLRAVTQSIFAELLYCIFVSFSTAR